MLSYLETSPLLNNRYCNFKCLKKHFWCQPPPSKASPMVKSICEYSVARTFSNAKKFLVPNYHFQSNTKTITIRACTFGDPHNFHGFSIYVPTDRYHTWTILVLALWEKHVAKRKSIIFIVEQTLQIICCFFSQEMQIKSSYVFSWKDCVNIYFNHELEFRITLFRVMLLNSPSEFHLEVSNLCTVFDWRGETP